MIAAVAWCSLGSMLVDGLSKVATQTAAQKANAPPAQAGARGYGGDAPAEITADVVDAHALLATGTRSRGCASLSPVSLSPASLCTAALRSCLISACACSKCEQ